MEKESTKNGKKKILIIAACIVVVAAIVTAILLFAGKNNKITISFDTDGAKPISSIEIKKGESITLPSVSKKGYTLDGWYLKDQRVTNSTTYDEDVTLKAKWISNDTKTYTVTFDSDGGSKIDSIKVECGKELSLPTNPTKDGYTFVSWVDKNETPVYDKALLSCEDITLKANWKKDEAKDESKNETKNETKDETKKDNSTPKQKSYKCPSGYTLDGTRCISQTEKIDVTESCEADYTYSKKQGVCYQSVSTIKVCKKYENNSGVLVQYNGHTYCTYSEYTAYAGSERSCDHIGYQYMNGKCYYKIIEDNYTLECESGYRYYVGLYFGNTQSLPVCARTKETIKSCASGYTQNGNYCYKTIDATYE